jgi:hypothetical protein
VAEAKRAAVDANDARRSSADHFEARARTETKLFQTADLIRRADELANLSDLAAAKKRNWDKLGHEIGRFDLRTNLNILYRPILERQIGFFNGFDVKNESVDSLATRG